jgi:hypothetical protein
MRGLWWMMMLVTMVLMMFVALMLTMLVLFAFVVVGHCRRPHSSFSNIRIESIRLIS